MIVSGGRISMSLGHGRRPPAVRPQILAQLGAHRPPIVEGPQQLVAIWHQLRKVPVDHLGAPPAVAFVPKSSGSRIQICDFSRVVS